jgi:uncharacterized protein (TIGR03437 family)
MKRISLFLLCSAALFAQQFMTGQAARAVIGQETFTSQDTNSSDTVVGGISGLAFAANTLFVADSNRVGSYPSNNRVLLFQNLSSQLPPPTAELPYNRKCPVCVGQANIVLGQPDFVTTTVNLTATQNDLRQPTAVASDGVHVVVADTDHNRVLVWNTIPSYNNAPADVVIGQADFVSVGIPGNQPNANSMRGPQGVWIQNGKLYVADTQNNRVLVYNHIPTTNGVAADVVIGAPNFTTFVEPDISQQTTTATSGNLLNPVSVTSDGVRLYVTDLGYNRVLIWNSIPTTNGAPADVEIGQPDMVSSIANNAYTGTAASSSTDTTDKEVPVLCTVSNGSDPAGNPTYPNGCNSTVSFPRFALAGGGRLFVADGGNDRVLVFNKVPTANATAADYILGQIGGEVDQATNDTNSLETPLSLAWDGTNLFVSDSYNDRIAVYSIGTNNVQYQAVRNAASFDITAHGTITIGGTIQAGDVATITINGTNYTYTVAATDTLAGIVTSITALLNGANNGAGDPFLIAVADTTNLVVDLNAKTSGDLGNNVTYSVVVTAAASTSTTTTTTAMLTATAAAANLTGGGDAASVAPGTIVSIVGTGLSANTVSVDPGANPLPTQLGGTEVYFNGIQAPLLYVSPTQINAQIPWELGDSTSINAYVRSVMSDGSIMVTTAVAATIVPANPGIFAQSGTSNPEIAVAMHSTSYATAVVSVDGSVTAGNVATVTVAGRSYSYTSQSTDTLDTIRDNLVIQINNDPQVSAMAAGLFDRIMLTTRVQGPEGNNIPITASASGGASNSSVTLTMTALDSQTCCGNIAGAPITQTNPALPGEIIEILATGLGVPVLSDLVTPLIQTGFKYPLGGPVTTPQDSVSSFVGGSTGDVLQATLLPGAVGIYEVLLHTNSSLATNPYAVVTIAQDVYTSNQVTVPVVNNGSLNVAPALSVSKTHTGNFTLGQQGATYTVTVSNVGTQNPTSGAVTLTDTLPAGETLVSIIGDGWSCTKNVCYRSDAIPAGGSYPTLTVTVNVASNAASNVTNTVTVTGGSSATATASDVTTITGS